MQETWKSPRKVEEEVRQYQRSRFEQLWADYDNGKITREEFVTQIALENTVEEWVEQGE